MITGSTYDNMSSFKRNFGIGTEPLTEDTIAWCNLGRTILKVFDRHKIANVSYVTCRGETIPSR